MGYEDDMQELDTSKKCLYCKRRFSPSPELENFCDKRCLWRYTH